MRGKNPVSSRRARPPPPRAKPGSGQEPTRVVFCPDSACAAEGAPGCKGIAGPKPIDAGEGAASPPAKPGSGREPARPKARQAAWASTGRSRATQGRAQPLNSSGRSPGRARSPLGLGPAQIQHALPKARQAARASPGRSLLTLGRAQLRPRRSPGRAGSPLRVVQRRARLYGRRLAEAEQRRGGCSPSIPPGEARVGPGAQCSAHSGWVLPRFSLRGRGRDRRHGRRRAEAYRRR